MEIKISKFAIISFVISLLVFVQAIIAFVDIPETHPLAPILFTIVLLIYLPDYPLGYLPQYLGFPVILPVLSVVLTVISFWRKEDKKIFSVMSLILILISLLLFLALRIWPQQESPISSSSQTNSAQPPSLTLSVSDFKTFFDESRWALVKSLEGDVDGDTILEKVILLKSKSQTGGGEFGDAPGPLYDADLIVLKDNRIIYDFSAEDDSVRFLMSQELELRDITGDNKPEIIFYSGTQRAANNWFDKAHILQNATGTFVDIAPEKFYDSLFHRFTIANFDGENFPIVSDAVYNDPERDCRMCVAFFKYQIYKWNGKKFDAYQILNGQKLPSSWGDYLKSDLEYIHKNLKK